MSGGSLNYFYALLQEHVGDFGDKELDELVKDLAKLFHAREWFLSADTGEGSWREAKQNFKNKWFGGDGVRLERIERYIDEMADELREELGVYDFVKCAKCSHWKPDRDNDYYGDCEYAKGYSTHRSEKCDRFEKAN